MTTTPSPSGVRFMLDAVALDGEVYRIEPSDLSDRHVVVVREGPYGDLDVADASGVLMRPALRTFVDEHGEIHQWT